MKKNKLSLKGLKVQSFTTENGKNVGGRDVRWSMGGAGACPHTGAETLDAIGCGTLDDFYCWNQSNGYNAFC